MENEQIEFENESIKTFLKNSLAILEIKKNAFSFLTNLPEGFTVLKWFDQIAKEKEVKGVLIECNSNSFCELPYKNFLSNISGQNLTEQEPHILKNIDKNIRARQIILLNSFTHSVLEFPKLVITVLKGRIVTPFIGLALASDIRIGTEKTAFVFLNKKYGLHPAGAVPFFLYTNLGLSKAKKILYTKDELNFEELESLGLIDKIITDAKPDDVIKYSLKLVEDNYDTIVSTKQLLNKTFFDQYKEFMDLEEQMVYS